MQDLSIRSGVIAFIRELREAHGVGDSVRVLGRLESFDAAQSSAVLEHEGARLLVETSLIDASVLVPESLFQFIGEIHLQQSGQDIFLRARVCRNIDGMDLHLFEEALKLRRKFLAEQWPRLMS